MHEDLVGAAGSDACLEHVLSGPLTCRTSAETTRSAAPAGTAVNVRQARTTSQTNSDTQPADLIAGPMARLLCRKAGSLLAQLRDAELGRLPFTYTEDYFWSRQTRNGLVGTPFGCEDLARYIAGGRGFATAIHEGDLRQTRSGSRPTLYRSRDLGHRLWTRCPRLGHR